MVNMSAIKIKVPHGTNRSDVRTKLRSFEEMMGKYGVSLDWRGDTAEIRGVGVSGRVIVDDADIEISLKLGMVARAAGVDPRRLERSIAKRLGEAFESGSG